MLFGKKKAIEEKSKDLAIRILKAINSNEPSVILTALSNVICYTIRQMPITDSDKEGVAKIACEAITYYSNSNGNANYSNGNAKKNYKVQVVQVEPKQEYREKYSQEI